MNACVCLFIIPSEVIFSASGSHSNNTRDTQEHLLFQQYIMQNDNSKQDHPGQEHYEQPYLNQATQKNTCQIFLPKTPGIENFKPKKILQSSMSLEIRSTPLGIVHRILSEKTFLKQE